MKILEQMFGKTRDQDRSEKVNANASGVRMYIKKDFTPMLHENRWEGSGFIYRRFNKNETVDVLEISPNSRGGNFGILVGTHFTFIALPHLQNLNEVTIPHLDIREDCGPTWNYPTTANQMDSLLKEMNDAYVSVETSFFKLFENWELEFKSISVEQIENDQLRFPVLTRIRAALLLAKTQQHIGNKRGAKMFSEYGLSILNKPSGGTLKGEFEAILKNCS